MLELITGIMDHAPLDSLFVVEADERFDFELLPGEWDIRTYSPAVVGVWHKRSARESHE
jgi:16S rRNA (guanine966-N2)-methyltransferase